MLGKSGFDEGMENLSEYIILIYFYGDTQGAKYFSARSSIPYPKAAISPRSTSLGQGIWTNFGPQCPCSCCNSCFQTFGAKETAARPGTVPWAPARLNPGYRPLAPFLRFTRFAYRWSLMVALLLLASSAERGS